jgi:hypothetical protein
MQIAPFGSAMFIDDFLAFTETRRAWNRARPGLSEISWAGGDLH